MTRRRVALLLLLAIGPTIVAGTWTPPAARAEEKKAERVDLEALKKQLESGDERQMLDALETIRKAKATEAAFLVNEVLRRGSSPKVCEAALLTAGALKSESSSEVVAPYLTHRSDTIRKEAARALIQTRGPAAVAALRRALRRGDAVVRGLAATGLGELGAHDALDDLTRALDQGVTEAAAAIGQVCRNAECDRLPERLKKMPFDVLASGFDQVLFRPAAEVSDDDKVRVIDRIRELKTAEARKLLEDVRERWPKGGSAKVKQALEAAIQALGGAR